MTRQIVMSEEEYEKLNENSVNIFLEQRVIELEEQLKKYQIFKENMEQDSDRLANEVMSNIHHPFEIRDDILLISDIEYYVMMFNSSKFKNLTEADEYLYDYLNNLAITFNVKLFCENQKELKRYRVALQNNNRYKAHKVKGIMKLTKY